ncbi:hypothetical protein EG328_000122 [Venturia inaequalis]|uniref:Uncharacterized protein n=1 Tax=Venturia inaequalis TaxID=5025 RepID=A0A8H3ZDD1_VENIN|nr:hypothetical protein EG328_000122 [Venturia inaequalis]
MKRVTIPAAMAAIAPLVGAQALNFADRSQAVVHRTLTSVVVVDLFPAVSTSTAYATSLVTILGCPPWETKCPVRHNSVAVVTLNTAVSTTVCPLTLTSSRFSSYDTEVVSTLAPTPPFLPTVSTTTTTWASNSPRPSQYPPLSIPDQVWASQSDISLGEPTGPLAGSKGDPAPTSLGSDFLNPPDASVDSSALSSLSSALSAASSTAANPIPTGAVAGSAAPPSSASPAPSAAISPAPASSASPAASNSVVPVLGGGSITLESGSSASSGVVSSGSSGNVIPILGGGSVTLDSGSSASSGVDVASSAASDSASPALTSGPSTASSTGSASGGSASSISVATETSGLLGPVTDNFGQTLSTSVSAHTDITTISGPSGVTVSISTGSVTILVGNNTTSVIQHFLPYTYSATQSTVTFPNVTYMPAATGNVTSNSSISTSTPFFSNDGTSAPVNMFSICLAIVALVLML